MVFNGIQLIIKEGSRAAAPPFSYSEIQTRVREG